MLSPLPKFNTIGEKEAELAATVIDGCPLSGFLGGELRGGTWVQALERQWARVFKVKHAIACNSATSGLLAAAHAAGVGPGSNVLVPTFTMSATAAAPAILGANIHFMDAEDMFFGNKQADIIPAKYVVFVTNLFGHPARLTEWRKFCDEHNLILIEDNAQAPFARCDGTYTGVIGHMGVFSLNVHKHIQCGEGGIVVTSDGELASRIRLFINHGELAGQAVGLNLRMTEVTAAIALSQLTRGEEIVNGRRYQAQKIILSIGGIPGLEGPATRHECAHVYYALAFRITNGRRAEIAKKLNEYGVPVKEGYLPLHRIPAFKKYAAPCPVADRLHDHELMLFENCAYSPTDDQIEQIGQAFRKAFK